MRPLNGETPAADRTANGRQGFSNSNIELLAQFNQTKQCTALDLYWMRDGHDWVLRFGKRKLGRVFQDDRYSGMWRSRRADGRLSDMANLSWAKNAVLLAAEREIGDAE
jgi:hypothetical protein